MVLMIVSGRSGSGKSVALRALEDMGFYCVDNLPVCIKSSRTPKVDRMKHNNPMASFFVVVRRNSTWY